MTFELTILGATSATPTVGKHPTAQLLNYNDQFYLIDCGEGTQVQLLRYDFKFNRINHIFISHLHGDHYFGLLGLLFSMHLQKRTNDLHLYAPRGLDEIILTHLKHSKSVLHYTLIFHPFEGNESVLLLDNEDITVTTIPMNHGILCCGFLFREKPKKLSINKEKLPTNLPVPLILALKEGEDIFFEGKLIRNEELTLPSKPLRSYAFCADTKYTERIIPQIQNVGCLYHEATFTEDLAHRIEEGTYHSTAKQAAMIAKKSNAKQLIIGHFSVRYGDLNVLLQEAKEVFENTVLAVEGQTYQITP
ncbi:MAG: ribonuclease Z [Thermoflexibacter sp.]